MNKNKINAFTTNNIYIINFLKRYHHLIYILLYVRFSLHKGFIKEQNKKDPYLYGKQHIVRIHTEAISMYKSVSQTIFI